MTHSSQPTLSSGSSEEPAPETTSEPNHVDGLIADGIALSENVTSGQDTAPDFVDSMRLEVATSIAATMANCGLDDQPQLQEEILEYLSGASSLEIIRFHERVTSSEAGWIYRERDPIARGICHVLMSRLITSDSKLHGAEYLEGLQDRQIVFFGNHLSAIDVHAKDILLTQAGFESFGENLAPVIAKKIFDASLLRQLSLAYSSIKVSQSEEDTTTLTREEKRVRVDHFHKVIATARERLNSGDRLTIFPEGTRSRTSTMLPFKPEVERYVAGDSVVIIPWAITGTERMYPPNQPSFHRSRVDIRIGKPIEANELAERSHGLHYRKRFMDTVGYAVSALLSKGYRGHYQTDNVAVENRDGYRLAQDFIEQS